MFTVERATPDMSEAFVPYFAQLMAEELRASAIDLDHPDHPVLTLLRRGWDTRVVAPCLDHAIRLAKEATAMQRRSSSSYLDKPIERETVTLTRTVAMPYGGYKNTRVVKKQITLAKIPPSRADEDPDT